MPSSMQHPKEQTSRLLRSCSCQLPYCRPKCLHTLNRCLPNYQGTIIGGLLNSVGALAVKDTAYLFAPLLLGLRVLKVLSLPLFPLGYLLIPDWGMRTSLPTIVDATLTMQILSSAPAGENPTHFLSCPVVFRLCPLPMPFFQPFFFLGNNDGTRNVALFFSSFVLNYQEKNALLCLHHH